MKVFLISTLVLTSLSAFAAPKDNCKKVALQLAAAVDKVYVPKLATGTKITASLIASNAETKTWNVNYLVPNAGGQTSYEIELGAEACDLIKMSSFSE
jgi:hypothetical protein